MKFIDLYYHEDSFIYRYKIIFENNVKLLYFDLVL